MTLTMFTEILKLSYVGTIVAAASLSAIKTSIALTLLRFLTSFYWRVFLWSMIALQGIYFIANTIWLLLECHPISAAWDPLAPPGACVSRARQLIASNTSTGFTIATDVILALSPLAFIVKLHRPLFERFLLGFLMGIGLIASAASIRKYIVAKAYGDPTADLVAASLSIVTWGMVEFSLSIIAACLPSLKVPLQRGLEYIGLPDLMRSMARSTPASFRYGTSDPKKATGAGGESKSGGLGGHGTQSHRKESSILRSFTRSHHERRKTEDEEMRPIKLYERLGPDESCDKLPKSPHAVYQG